MATDIQLTKEARQALRIVTTAIENASFDEKIPLWKGIADLAPKDSPIGISARHNLYLLNMARTQQQEFKNLL